ncbi:hypothetical protein [Micromonospora endophytica]|uniref:Uncharacterized protein n=1 Tax=Micromonospora endophytica TaxID=515350 RepID=A0A2W2BKK8_9ACTN|nr:hypothetical protein [Micromonospora endophytica]PZF87951.1 hypothetical protein C1I93_25570 [Micromonospora endophytica]RIW41116.1 hypothetical protein D3H59_27115 [Micromonospora endophytica]BCJ60635.1 hypothetical protein Jiend_40570 [Micromonospora endophytica]
MWAEPDAADRTHRVPGPRTPELVLANRAGRAAAAVARISDRGARIVVVTIALVWHLAIGLPAVLAARAEPAVPQLVIGCWLLVAVLGVLAGVRLLRDAPLPAPPLVALLLVVDVVVFAALGRAQVFGPANWVWGGLAWFFVVVLWRQPVRWLLALLVAHAGVGLAAVVLYDATEAADLARATMALYGTSSLPAAVFAGATTLAALSRDRTATAAATNAMLAERAAAEQARRERTERLALVSAAAEEVLTELAQGRADPTDPQVQRRCARAAARLRRLIAESDDVPHPLLHELRAAADLAERNGLPIELVTIGTPPPLPVRVRRSLADPLAAGLADARDWARLTVVSSPDEVVVGLVTPDAAGPEAAPPPTEDGAGEVEFHYERDGKIRWTQTRWRR